MLSTGRDPSAKTVFITPKKENIERAKSAIARVQHNLLMCPKKGCGSQPSRMMLTIMCCLVIMGRGYDCLTGGELL
jgi:hypothetical protein